MIELEPETGTTRVVRPENVTTWLENESGRLDVCPYSTRFAVPKTSSEALVCFEKTWSGPLVAIIGSTYDHLQRKLGQIVILEEGTGVYKCTLQFIKPQQYGGKLRTCNFLFIAIHRPNQHDTKVLPCNDTSPWYIEDLWDFMRIHRDEFVL